ncbi:MAG TPA: hypothetical protein VHH88_08645 [Verrucomicrobiae bacterium]|nr:hypothetical protein [Verrucomicrobiae bacterium]
MKKIIIRVIVVVIILILLAILSVHLFLDGVVQRSVEFYGPKMTKTDVKLGAVHLSLLSGAGKLSNFVVGNPEGFKTPSAIEVGSTSIALEPGSIFGSKVIIRSINVQKPEVTFESDLKSVNLQKILSNVEDATGGGEGTKEPAKTEPAPAKTKGGKKLEVDDLVISGGKVHVSLTSLGRSATVDLPEIHLTNLGKDSDGITGAELAKVVLKKIVSGAEDQALKVTGLNNGIESLTKGVDSNTVNSVTKGLKGFFKKSK